jgi:hypothetical protein
VRGEAFRDSTTAHAPVSAPGYNAWQGAVTALRDILLPLGWQKNSDKNLETVLSPCREHKILVVSGDKNTGSDDPLLVPQPKRPRGEATEFAVDRSQLSLPLFGTRKAVPSRQGPVIWFLLIYRVEGRDEVRAEISLPSSMDDAGYVMTWHHRHNLGTINLGPAPEPTRDDTMQSETTVEVKRKS